MYFIMHISPFKSGFKSTCVPIVDCKEFLWRPHRLKPCKNLMLLLGFERFLGEKKLLWQEQMVNHDMCRFSVLYISL